MRPNVFDVFSDFGGGQIPSFGGIYVGIVKKYDSTTKSCMVLVPEIDRQEVLGPFRTTMPFINPSSYVAPSLNDKVIVAFLDESLENAVLLGVLNG